MADQPLDPDLVRQVNEAFDEVSSWLADAQQRAAERRALAAQLHALAAQGRALAARMGDLIEARAEAQR